MVITGPEDWGRPLTPRNPGQAIFSTKVSTVHLRACADRVRDDSSPRRWPNSEVSTRTNWGSPDSTRSVRFRQPVWKR